MFKLFIAFSIACIISVVNSASTWSVDIPLEVLCSINGSGFASVTGLGDNLGCIMKRVRNFVRYDFYDSNLDVIASLLVRPDLNKTFFSKGSSCSSLERPLSLTYYDFYRMSSENFVFTLDSSASMTLDEYDTLIGEHFAGLPGGVEIDIKYNSVQYEYEDSGDFFVLNNCPEAQSVSTDARTSLQCTMSYHFNMCSFHGVGKATVSGSQDVFSAEVFRVSNTVRYDLFEETSDGGRTIRASLVMRDDLGKSFIYNSSLSVSCYPHPFQGLNSYDWNETVNGYDIYMPDRNEKQKVLIGHLNNSLLMEVVPFYNNQTGDDVAVTIRYESVDFDYKHENEDDLFSLTNSLCPEAESHANNTITSAVCPRVLTPVLPGCSFVYNLTKASDPTAVYTYKVHAASTDNGFIEGMWGDSVTGFFRCDVRSLSGQCLTVAAPGTDHCNEMGQLFEQASGFSLFFLYWGDPEDVDCPDKSAGCKKYSYSNKTYAIVDKEGRYVYNMGYFFSYIDDDQHLFDNFTFKRCNGDVMDPPVYPQCRAFSSSIGSMQSDITDWWVEIEFEEGTKATEVNDKSILETLSIECGLEIKDLAIQIETDEHGYVIRIIIYTKDEKTALSIGDTLNSAVKEKGEKCQLGILCRAKIVTVHLPFKDLSGSSRFIFSYVFLILLSFVTTLE